MISIVYVDKEPANLEAGKHFLEQSGEFSVDTITSVPAALALLNSKTYDAIIADYRMPEINGIEFLKQVRESRNPVPVIIFTGQGREEVAIRALDDSAVLYFQKCSDPKTQSAELSDTIQNAVLRRRAEEALRLADKEFLKKHEGLNAICGQISAAGEEICPSPDDLTLRESEARYRSVISAFPDIIAITDMDGRIQMVSPAVLRIYGFRHENEIIGQPVTRFIVPGDHGRSSAIAALMRQGIFTEPREYRSIRADGTTFDIEVNAEFVRDAGGQPTGIVFVVRNITGRKMTEEALRQANRKLSLLSGITRHDIDNQLTVVMGYLAILEEEQNYPLHNEYLRKASTAAQRISAMIRFTREYESIGVNAPVWQNCRTFTDTAIREVPHGNIIVKNDFSAGTEVFADLLIVKVFYNLLDNAVRYGGKTTTIRFSEQESGDGHLIICEDDGDGIPDTAKEQIFHRGFGKNTGLGLFLSREILSITGITIRETGQPGKGARFEVLVPKSAYRPDGHP
jgi:PAS domain S-box-containing protein